MILQLVIVLFVGCAQAQTFLTPTGVQFAAPQSGSYCTTVTKSYIGSGTGGTPYTQNYSITSGQSTASLTGFYQQGCSNPYSVSVQACDAFYPEVTLNINGRNTDSAAIIRRAPYRGVARVTLTVYCYRFTG